MKQLVKQGYEIKDDYIYPLYLSEESKPSNLTWFPGKELKEIIK